MRRYISLLAALLFVSAARPASLTQLELFRAGEGSYHSYRIPALIATPKGTLLAFCEGRKNSGNDAGDIDVLLRRSFDRGKTWSAVEKVADKGADTIGNPTGVVERKTGTIFLLLTANPGNATERQITEAAPGAVRSVWITRSTDDGASWSPLVNITAQVKRPDWTWYATGPGNGIQLRGGRLVIPCDHNGRSHIIYSDDRGATWNIGGSAEDKTNESAIAELKDGSLLLNMRSYHGKHRRAIQHSPDGGLTWTALAFDNALIEPVCEASLISIGRGRLLFANPAATTRSHLTVRLSKNDGTSWSASHLLYEGPSAYSSLTQLPDGTIGLLYERGDRSPYEQITFARFDIYALLTK